MGLRETTPAPPEHLHVTRATLPVRDTFRACVDEIFASRQLTNNGPLLLRLEQRIAEFLGTPHVSLCANGTLALMLALRAAGLNGKKVIVTPFTYVATVSALLWEGCIPVFADIDPATLCLSPEAVKAAFAAHPDAAAVLAVHVYGNTCDVHAIDDLCAEHGAVAVYDAAHAFGTTLDGTSLVLHGDFSVCSFHATKLFHTAEGGCVISRNEKGRQTINLLRSFGHIGDEHFCLGINAKMSELHAAMGLSLLPEVPKIIARRKLASDFYDAALAPLALQKPIYPSGLSRNYAYYPVLVRDAVERERVLAALTEKNIHPRRYFYPSCNTLPYIEPQWRISCPTAEDTAARVLCLPLHSDMDQEIVAHVAETLARILHHS